MDQRHPKFPLGRLLNLFGPWFGLLLVLGLFSLSNEVRPFLFTANFKIILTQTVVVALGALGMTMIIVSGGIDLSVGSVVALTSVCAPRSCSKVVPRPPPSRSPCWREVWWDWSTGL